MEQQELDQGEPYDAKVAEGLHPNDPVELEQIRVEKLMLQEEKEKQAQEKERPSKWPTLVEAIKHAAKTEAGSE